MTRQLPEGRGRRAVPDAYINLVATFVDIANKLEGAPITATHPTKRTAFERAYELLHEASFPVDAGKLKNWYEMKPKKPAKND